MNVITVVGDITKQALDQAVIDSITQTLGTNGAEIASVNWLSPSIACDIFVENTDATIINEIIGRTIGDQPFDFIVQPEANRRKKMIISDMDSTIIQQECIDEIADFAGIKEQISDITERAMNGELDFAEALRERVSLLKGLPEGTLAAAYEKKITFTPGAKALVQTMRKNGSFCLLVSGGFTFFTERVVEALGFHKQESNRLEIVDGLLTGEVFEPILDKNSKLNSLHFYAKKQNISEDDVLAVGDGANDLPMIQAAGLGVAFYAKPFVQQQVMAKINHTDLTTLLYAQGYTQKDIIDA